MKHLDLFSGIGGFAIAVDTVWPGSEHIFCDNNKFCQMVLKNHWPNSKIYGDIRAITNAERMRKLQSERREQNIGGWISNGVDILTGGFPCQPFSAAGKRRGTEDDRHLWPEMLRVIRLTQPTWVIAENVRGLITIDGGLVFEQVCLDLEASGYEVQPFIIPAVAVNAPHRRDRVWIVAHARYGNGQRAEDNGEPEGQIPCPEDAIKSKRPDSDERKRSYSNSNGEGLQGDEQPKAPEQSKGTSRPVTKFYEDDPNLSGRRTSGYSKSRKQNGEKACWGRYYNNDWQRNWLEVATRFCGMDARFSDWLDKHMNDVICFNYETCKKDKKQALQILFNAIQSPEIRQKIGGLWEVDGEEILLETVCQLQRRTRKSERIQLESEEISQGEMRVLPEYQKIRCTSQGWEYQKQLAKKFNDIMPELPYEVALEIVETGNILWGAYSAIYSQEVKLDGFKLTKAGHRVERLKSLGNAIVPQVAIEIMKAIKLCNYAITK